MNEYWIDVDNEFYLTVDEGDEDDELYLVNIITGTSRKATREELLDFQDHGMVRHYTLTEDTFLTMIRDIKRKVALKGWPSYYG